MPRCWQILSILVTRCCPGQKIYSDGYRMDIGWMSIYQWSCCLRSVYKLRIALHRTLIYRQNNDFRMRIFWRCGNIIMSMFIFLCSLDVAYRYSCSKVIFSHRRFTRVSFFLYFCFCFYFFCDSVPNGSEPPNTKKNGTLHHNDPVSSSGTYLRASNIVCIP